MDSIAQDKAIKELEKRMDHTVEHLINLQRYVMELQDLALAAKELKEN